MHPRARSRLNPCRSSDHRFIFSVERRLSAGLQTLQCSLVPASPTFLADAAAALPHCKVVRNYDHHAHPDDFYLPEVIQSGTGGGKAKKKKKGGGGGKKKK